MSLSEARVYLEATKGGNVWTEIRQDAMTLAMLCGGVKREGSTESDVFAGESPQHIHPAGDLKDRHIAYGRNGVVFI